MTRNVLILSGRLGKGHDTVAEATAAALEPLDVECRIVDAMKLLGDAGGRAGERIFRSMLAVPAIYDALHFSQLRRGTRVARFLDRAAVRVAYPNFLREIEGFRPDLIMSVFATGGAVASRYKRDRPDVVTAVLMTDSYAHLLWVHPGTDIFVVTSTLGMRSVQGMRPAARVAVVSHPARPEFYAAPSQGEARRSLGVPGDATCVLLMSGAWGVGPIAASATGLAQAGMWVLAVAGSNERLHRKLLAASRADSRIVPFGFTDRIPELMAASDVVISSSGDTCREARVVGRRLVLIDVVPGHGRENLMHEVELGGAIISSTQPAVLVGAVQALLADPSTAAPQPVTSAEAWQRELRAALATVEFH